MRYSNAFKIPAASLANIPIPASVFMMNDRCEHYQTMREAIDSAEIELIALKDVRDIITMIPVENPTHRI